MILETAYTTLERVSQIADKNQRRTELRRILAEKKALALVVQYAYHPDVVFDLPDGEIPDHLFKPAKHDDHSIFYQNVKRLKNLFVGSPVKRGQKEMLYVGLMCDVAGNDSMLLKAIKDKKLPWKTLNKAFCVKTLPELFPDALQNQVEEENA